MLLNLDFMDGIKQPFMPYGKGYSYDLAQAYFEEIGTKPKAEEKFLNDMKIFIPKIKRIVADTKNGVIEILDEDFPDEFTPLHQYGEGANKLFRILILLSLHKGKKVLIDEFDAGIHYTRFKKFWKTILEIAGNDQTQIFVTTHNDECIQYFADVLAELGIWHQHQSRVVQLKKVNQAIKIRSYEFDSFSLAIKDSVELRGGFVA
jgi:AAA15 family ATPase/GTPase